MKTASLAALLLSIVPVATMANTNGAADALVDEVSALQSSAAAPELADHWVQAGNRKEKCAVHFIVPETPTDVKWFGDCANGKATGVGISVGKLAAGERSFASLEEHRGDGRDDLITYRQIDVTKKGTTIFNGVSAGSATVGERTQAHRTAQGNLAITTARSSCYGGECTSLTMDLTNSATYIVHSVSGTYRLISGDFRADVVPLFSRDAVLINGVMRADVLTLDNLATGAVMNVQTGRPEPTAIAGRLSQLLNSPRSRYASVEASIDRDVAQSTRVFESVRERFCTNPADEGVQKICDPQQLIPKDTELAAGRAELNQIALDYASQYRNQRAQMTAALNAQAAQQAQVAEARRQQDMQALQQGINALNQAALNAQRQNIQLQQMISVPQVQPPTPPGRSGVICRTIGYMTYCN